MEGRTEEEWMKKELGAKKMPFLVITSNFYVEHTGAIGEIQNPLYFKIIESLLQMGKISHPKEKKFIMNLNSLQIIFQMIC